ncbi:response regulator [Paenibacillus antri]|uniref:Transcriptional regulatory protein n=1 Tax=Paenibacillus antri TaxID=2582848 RepID=A0A5R9G8A7_9BACL|nr:response regulator [Paenibacillus antri]TLS50310.1 response regulator [Paenibacillus antri]
MNPNKEPPIEVLIVEDDLRIAEIHRRFTEKHDGFRIVATASTGEEAKDWLSVVKPNLVLLDVYLPDMLGIDLVRFIRNENLDTDIIMITAASETDVVKHAMHGGVFDFIMKPLTYERFKNSLDRYREARAHLRGSSRLTSEQIERLWQGTVATGAALRESSEAMPKGIDPLTLEKVMESIRLSGPEGVTAESVSGNTGLSRSTSRRYLEYLVSQKKLTAQLNYGTIGRPERRYVAKP